MKVIGRWAAVWMSVGLAILMTGCNVGVQQEATKGTQSQETQVSTEGSILPHETNRNSIDTEATEVTMQNAVDLSGEWKYVKIKDFSTEGFNLSWYCYDDGIGEWKPYEYFQKTGRPWFGGYGDWYCSKTDPDWFVLVRIEEAVAQIRVWQASTLTAWGGDNIPLQ